MNVHSVCARATAPAPRRMSAGSDPGACIRAEWVKTHDSPVVQMTECSHSGLFPCAHLRHRHCHQLHSITGARRLDGAPDSTAKPARSLRVSMAHKTVQFIIVQSLTDEALRAQFLDEPIETLSALRDSGFDLTNAEIDALGRTDRRLWTSGAQWIDARLQRCDLGSGGRNVAKPKTPR